MVKKNTTDVSFKDLPKPIQKLLKDWEKTEVPIPSEDDPNYYWEEEEYGYLDTLPEELYEDLLERGMKVLKSHHKNPKNKSYVDWTVTWKDWVVRVRLVHHFSMDKYFALSWKLLEKGD